MRWFASLVLALALGVMGCGETSGTGGDAGSGGIGGSAGDGGTGGAGGSEFPEAEAAALQALDEFNRAFNAEDEEAWAATLNYPHVRFGGLKPVGVWNTPEEFIDPYYFEKFKLVNPGWDHSEWDSIEIVQSGPDRIHIALVFSRYDPDGNVLKTFKTSHIMTLLVGHWEAPSALELRGLLVDRGEPSARFEVPS